MSDSVQPDTQEVSSALDELKSLLIGPEKQELSQLRERIDDPGLRAEDMALVLADAIRLTEEQGGELTDALEVPVSDCIKRSANKNPELFAESFYPVISPAIRKSISSALKELVDTINQTLDHSFTLKGLKWRLESIRTGVPFPEVVLRHTLLYRVEQVLLIRPESGLLIQQVTDSRVSESDPDAVSAMLTAISDFVRNAFLSGDSDRSLDTVDMGEYTLHLFHGPQAYLALLVRGIAPASLRNQGHDVLEKIHRNYSSILKEFDGEKDKAQPLVPLLKSCLAAEKREQVRGQRISTPFVIVLLLIISAIGWFSYGGYLASRDEQALQVRFDTLVREFEQTPGIFLTSVDRRMQTLHIDGLRDGLAVDPEQLVAASGLEMDQVKVNFLPYQDMTPVFVRKRLDAWLDPPGSVNVSVDDHGVLKLSGSASREWLERAEMLAAVVPGISRVDSSGLLGNDQALLKAAREKLKPLPDVELYVEDGVLFVRGIASSSWVRMLEALPRSLPGLDSVESTVTLQEQLELEEAARRLHEQAVLFSEDVEIAADHQQVVSDVSRDIEYIRQLSSALSLTPRIYIIGYTDGIGVPAYNRMLANARAHTVYDQLVEYGVPQELLRLKESAPLPATGWEDPAMRRVDFQLQLDPQTNAGDQSGEHAG
ncbi:MAG: OmpA family protein [Candidatus Sedimenticola sp. PURPLELP]